MSKKMPMPAGSRFTQQLSAALICCSALLFSACSSDSDDPMETEDSSQSQPPPSPPPSNNATSATYDLTFNASWSADTHPTNFPLDPHFSGLVGAVHNEQVVFWESGQIATDGVRQVAETGAKGTFLTEINAAVDSGLALAEISGGGIGTSPNSVSVQFTVTSDYPLVSVISMLAPSPDWIVGVDRLSLMDNGEFVDTLSVDLPLYDAGTDSGSAFTSANLPTEPREIIQRVSSDSADTDFENGLPLVGQFVFTRTE